MYMLLYFFGLLNGITDFSFPRTKGTYGELSFPGPFVLGNFRSRRTKVLGNFRSWDLSYPGTFVPIIR